MFSRNADAAVPQGPFQLVSFARRHAIAVRSAGQGRPGSVRLCLLCALAALWLVGLAPARAGEFCADLKTILAKAPGFRSPANLAGFAKCDVDRFYRNAKYSCYWGPADDAGAHAFAESLLVQVATCLPGTFKREPASTSVSRNGGHSAETVRFVKDPNRLTVEVILSHSYPGGFFVPRYPGAVDTRPDQWGVSIVLSQCPSCE